MLVEVFLKFMYLSKLHRSDMSAEFAKKEFLVINKIIKINKKNKKCLTPITNYTFKLCLL